MMISHWSKQGRPDEASIEVFVNRSGMVRKAFGAKAESREVGQVSLRGLLVGHAFAAGNLCRI